MPPVQAPAAPLVTKSASVPASRKWYEKYSYRGYTQFRCNRLFSTNALLACEQCDRSVGNNGGVFIRRARFILSGDVSEQVFMYFQPDFASTSGNLNYGQIRDLYFDITFDRAKEFRVRVGQSKVPFGFENLQSSQNRVALDRTDALNSAVPSERDVGAFLYWAPAHIRSRFTELVNRGLKGSGDYGVLGAGAFNGQSLSRAGGNSSLHRVVRASYPFRLKNGQFIEPGIQAFSGRYAVTTDQRGASVGGPVNFADRRVAGGLVMYPSRSGFKRNTISGPVRSTMPGKTASSRAGCKAGTPS